MKKKKTFNIFWPGASRDDPFGEYLMKAVEMNLKKLWFVKIPRRRLMQKGFVEFGMRQSKGIR